MGGVALVRYTQFNCASIANRSVRWMVLAQLTMCVHAAVLAWVVWAACMGGLWRTNAAVSLAAYGLMVHTVTHDGDVSAVSQAVPRAAAAGCVGIE